MPAPCFARLRHVVNSRYKVKLNSSREANGYVFLRWPRLVNVSTAGVLAR
jgi:hypothetical protein